MKKEKRRDLLVADARLVNLISLILVKLILYIYIGPSQKKKKSVPQGMFRTFSSEM